MMRHIPADEEVRALLVELGTQQPYTLPQWLVDILAGATLGLIEGARNHEHTQKTILASYELAFRLGVEAERRAWDHTRRPAGGDA